MPEFRVLPVRFPAPVRVVAALAVATSVSGCAWMEQLSGDEPPTPQYQATRQNSSGAAGMTVAANPAATTGVNAFLWRASLETLAFMPIVQADPYGGVILTDWYSPPGAQSERFKVNLYILDAALRADGVRATVFRQVLDNAGWRDASVAPETQIQLEDSILTKARQLRIASTPTAR